MGKVWVWLTLLFHNYFLDVLCSNLGHGGSRTAEYLKNNLFKNLSSHPDFIKDTKSAIGMILVDLLRRISCYSLFLVGYFITENFVAAEVFRKTDADYLNEEKGQARDAGSTASTAVLVGDRMLVANVGDSRVVACRAGSGCFLLY